MEVLQELYSMANGVVMSIFVGLAFFTITVEKITMYKCAEYKSVTAIKLMKDHAVHILIIFMLRAVLYLLSFSVFADALLLYFIFDYFLCVCENFARMGSKKAKKTAELLKSIKKIKLDSLDK